jgi:hypothetical protein
MALIVCNLTSSAVTLARGARTIVVPPKVGSLTYGPPVDVTSTLQGLAAGDYTALESQRAGTVAYYWTTGVPEFAVGTLTVAANVNGVAVLNTTTTVTGVVETRKVGFPSTTKAADYVSVVNAVQPASGAQAIALQPDQPRKLQVNIVTGSTTGTITLVGVGANGQAVTDAIDISVGVGTRTTVTANAYATLTSATISSLTGAAGTVGIGLAASLALPTNKTPAATSLVVFKEQCNGLDETIGTVDTTAMTVAPTTPADGAHSFDFWYTITITPVSPAHNHTLA